MSKQQTKDSQDLGLKIAALCGRHFLKLEHLHYGYWNNGLAVDIANLHIAPPGQPIGQVGGIRRSQQFTAGVNLLDPQAEPEFDVGPHLVGDTLGPL